MRIAMLLDSPFRSDGRVEKEAADLLAAGHAVSVTCMRAEGLPADEERNGVRIRRRFGEEIKSPFRRSYRDVMATCVDAVLDDEYDVLHCHDYHMLGIGVRAKARRPTPLVYDAHEYLSGWPFFKDSRGFLNRLKGRLVWRHEVIAERRNVRHADRLVTVSHAMGRAFSDRFDLAHEPVVVRNVPRAHPVSGDREKLSATFGLPEEKRVLLYSGAMYHTDRQLRALYDAVAGIDGLVLLVLGSLRRHGEAREMAKERGIEGAKVFFGEYVTNPAARQDLISGADVALMHVRSSWEGHRITFSNKFLEYTFAGLPIVAAYQEDLVDIGREYGHALFYEEDDDAALRAHILTALRENESMRARLPAAREDFSWAREVESLLDMYASLA